MLYSMAKICKESERYKIVRETRAESPYEYDFVLYADTDSSDFNSLEEITTSTKLGIGFNDVDNWTRALTIFAEKYLQTEIEEEALAAVRERNISYEDESW